MLFSFSLLAFLANSTQAQYFNWAKQFIGINNNYWDIGISNKVDSQGNVYNTGYFHGTVDFDPNGGETLLTANGQNEEIFISKLSPDGNLLWVHAFGSNEDDRGMVVNVDHDDNVYVSGYFTGNVDFDPSAGVNTLTGDEDFFLLKLSSEGDFLWAKNIGESNSALAQAIAITDDNDVIVAASFYGDVDVDPGSGVNLIESEETAVVIIKFTASGEFQWAAPIIGSGVYISEMVIDPQGRICSTGGISVSADLDPGSSTLNFINPGGAVFLQVLSENGGLIWAKQFGGVNGSGQDMRIDDQGNFYIAGSYNFSTDFDPAPGEYIMASAGSMDAFLVKLNADGNLVWAKSLGGTQGERAKGLEINNGDLIITGYFGGTSDLQFGDGQSLFTSAGLNDIFITSLTTDGAFNWVSTFGGSSDDSVSSISQDGNGSFHITGSLQGTADLDPTEAVANFTSGGTLDVYQLKFSELPASVPNIKHLDVTAYPNPSEDVIQFVTSGKITSIDLFDMSGKFLLTVNDSFLNMAELPAGIYTVLIRTSDGIVSRHISRL